MNRFRLTLLACSCLLLLAGSAQGQPSGLVGFQQQSFGNYLVTTQSSLEWTPAPVPGETVEAHALRVAELYLIDNGYLTQPVPELEKGGSPVLVGAKLLVAENTITISWSIPGSFDVVIVLSNGPFVPIPTQHDLKWIHMTAIHHAYNY